jgi:hypothetical protein
MRTLLLTGKWWVRHLLVLGAIVACALLGRWQFDKGVFGSGDLVNLGYGLQWWSFAAIIVFGWWRAVRHELRPKVHPAETPGDDPPQTEVPSPAAGEPTGAGPACAPAGSLPVPASLFAGRRRPVPDGADDEEDPELAAYNAYLARLNARSR